MAGRGLGTLTLDLIAKIGGFTGPLDKASRTAEKRMSEIEKRAKRFGTAFGLALTAAATSAGYAIKQAIDQADQLNEISQKIGIPTDVLSGLNYAAKLAGVATEELQNGLVKLSKFQADAAQGGKDSTKVFNALGIAVKDAGGNLRASDQVFGDFAEVFKNLRDGPEKTALALKVFGKAGAELIPLLNEGRTGIAAYSQELRELGGEVSPEAAKAADEFNDNVDKLKVAVSGLALSAAKELLPALIEITKWLGDAAKSNADASGKADTAKESFLTLADSIKLIRIELGFLEQAWQQQGIFGEGIFSVLRRAREEFEKQKALADSIALTAAVNGSPGNPAGRGVASARAAGRAERGARALYTPDVKAKKSGKSDAQKAAEELEAAYARMNAQMAEQIALFGVTSEVVKVRYDLENGELAKLSEAKKAELLDKAKTLDLLAEEKRLLDERNKAEQEKLDQQIKAKESVALLLDDMQFELDLLGKTNAARIAEIELRRIGIGLTPQEIADAKARIEAKAQEFEAVRKQIDAMDEFRQSFADNLTDVLTGSKSIADAFKSMADAIINQIARMIAQNWTEQLFGQMGSSGTGSAGGGIFSLFSSFLGGARAAGGPVSGNVPYLVGEKGPEIMVPRSAGTVIPNHKIGGGLTVNQNFNVSGETSRATREQIAASALQGAQRALARSS